ncbi:PD-(D/E)XK nuclease family protein [Hymenobacter sp. M29]|uniref:PD-(D/E)XK nuclease family protein n=1 Tax=Hymenobacter mellowenesis TaxID=3063995 RepID=A0ABT9AH40_9BACT|nr:PD-(D/E)XK nuclease family protein [Hymenobacter sp. M29]MDO7848687.1 PD-(D/E)XK nuclease family protein [Hymenobacter sp. M29]
MSLTFSTPTRLSPSQYGRALACPYQFLLAKTPEAQVLVGTMSSGGAAAVGTIVHGMLERAVTTDLSIPTAFETAWQQLLTHQEARLLKDGSTHLVPLAFRARGYAVTKLLLRWYLANKPMPIPAPSGTGLPFGPEQRLTDLSGCISGIADFIRLGTDGPEIVDYKTGPIFQLNANAEAEIKPAYAQQLQLYAALFYEQAGCWPTRLLLVDLAGNEHEVGFTESACLQLLDEARHLLAQMQSAVAAGNPESMAAPGIEQCRFCQVRPLCGPFEAWSTQI